MVLEPLKVYPHQPFWDASDSGEPTRHQTMGSNQVAGVCLDIHDQGNVLINSNCGMNSKCDDALLPALGPPTAGHHGTGA